MTGPLRWVFADCRIERAGVPVGKLRPLPRPRVTASTLLARWRSVPVVEWKAFRADIDAVLDPSL